jgi:tetratricopeptide (TPR) repeat protein
LSRKTRRSIRRHVGFQLALFPGAPSDGDGPSAPVLPASPELLELAPTQQMGLFDAQVRQLRDALEALALADLPRARQLLEGVPRELDSSVPLLRARVAELHDELAGLESRPPSAGVSSYLDRGRQLVHEGEPWCRLGRALIARAAADVAGNDVLAGRLFLEATHLTRARSVLLGISGPRHAAAQFALGDVELALGDRSAARKHYRDALLLDPFDDAFDKVADVEVHGLPSFAEFEVEIDSEPRAWCGAVGIVAGLLPRPLDLAAELPLPEHRARDASSALCRARQFVDALVRAASPDVQKDREAMLESRRAMKRASGPLFAWYMARLGTR